MQEQKHKINHADFIGKPVGIIVLWKCYTNGILTDVSGDVLTLRTNTGEIKLLKKDVGKFFPPECFDVRGKLTDVGRSWTCHYPELPAKEVMEILEPEREFEKMLRKLRPYNTMRVV